MSTYENYKKCHCPPSVMNAYWQGSVMVENINNNNKNTMNNFFKKLTDKKLQALVKAGYISSDLKITVKGHAALMDLLFLVNYDELVKLANEETEETEKKK